MKIKWLIPIFIDSMVFVTVSLPAQEKQTQPSDASSQTASYEVARETTLVGTVVFYSVSSNTAPRGPRVLLQTSSGIVDAHLGDARLLATNKFTIESGDSLRIIGENITFSGETQFVARIIQKGTQALVVRSTKGFPIANSVSPSTGSPRKNGSVL